MIQKQQYEPSSVPSSSHYSSSSSFWSWMKMSLSVLLPPIYIGYRIYWSNRLPITDCDEVYNYWEPLHFLIYNSTTTTTTTTISSSTSSKINMIHTGGQQTWEYAHQYALRTYMYLIPLKVWYDIIVQSIIILMNPKIFQLVQLLSDYPIVTWKVATFVLLRATIATCTATTELIWLYTLSNKFFHNPNPNNHNYYYYNERFILWISILLLTCTGMNHCAGAFLPSVTYMSMWMLGSAFYLQQQYQLFIIIAIGTTLCTGWPFGVILFIPMAIDILIQSWYNSKNNQLLLSILLGTITWTIIIQGCVMMIDRYYYNKWISPTWNIFLYNAAGGGDEYYGIEPLSYYIKNLFLNLNFLSIFGLLGILVHYYSYRYQHEISIMFVSLVPWILIVFPRPHKEERFLFPIYPVFVVSAVFVIDSMINAIGRMIATISRHKHLIDPMRFIIECICYGPILLLSMSRTMALYKYYTAPLAIYAMLAQQIHNNREQQQLQKQYHQPIVCTCGEWYRYPSTFYLNDHNNIHFISSSFHGQLPQPFSMYGSRIESISIQQPFNNQNQHESSRYDTNINQCDYIIELMNNNNNNRTDCWDSTILQTQILYSYPFLHTLQTSQLHRTFYIPYWHEYAIQHGQVMYQSYELHRVLHS